MTHCLSCHHKFKEDESLYNIIIEPTSGTYILTGQFCTHCLNTGQVEKYFADISPAPEAS